jgi:hypothetical protein
MQEHQSKFQKAKLCSLNNAHEARNTIEGWVCRIYGKVCPYQTQMSKSFTNYYFCGKISTAQKYEQKYTGIIRNIPAQDSQTRMDGGQHT